MVNSIEKGKRGEREFASFLRSHGIESKRGQQYSGGQDSPDVIVPAHLKLHFEVKRVERLQLYQAMSQAIRDSGSNTPVVAHKKNRSDWLVVLRAEDFLKLIEKKG